MMQKNENTELALSGIFESSMSIESAVAGFKKIHEVSEKLLTSNDYAMIKVRRRMPDGSWKTEERPFRKKSGWDKLSCFFSASTETTKIQRIDNPDGSFSYSVSVRAYRKLPNGFEYSKVRSALVSSLEKEGTEAQKNSPRKEHDVMSSAETRAFGRAMSSYFGLGELTAEEIEGGVDDDNVHISPDAKRACKCDQATKNANPRRTDGSCPVCGGARF